MKAGIIKFIEGERPSRQSIVDGATRRSSGDVLGGAKGREETHEEKSSARGRCVSGNRKAITN